ncbi:MAG: DoxX family protein [Planctomycetota bacterium]|nr:MAG: DoxX family protein [Planctomycetota bacterium]
MGRIALAAIFLASGFGKIANFSGTAAFMASKGIPITSFLLIGAITFLLIGALSLILGLRARFGALLLIVFLVPTTLIFHPPWDSSEQIQFLKNIGLIGGLLMVMAHGSGAFSLERCIRGGGGKS